MSFFESNNMRVSLLTTTITPMLLDLTKILKSLFDSTKTLKAFGVFCSCFLLSSYVLPPLRKG
uniref:Uncharacterized protein n=1 Tax=Cannabis sativa TaxID=3483 RepID=A0A803R2T5_CANSA